METVTRPPRATLYVNAQLHNRTVFAQILPRECGSHFPLEDRQACLSGEERGNIDAKRQNPLVRLPFFANLQFYPPSRCLFLFDGDSLEPPRASYYVSIHLHNCTVFAQSLCANVVRISRSKIVAKRRESVRKQLSVVFPRA